MAINNEMAAMKMKMKIMKIMKTNEINGVKKKNENM